MTSNGTSSKHGNDVVSSPMVKHPSKNTKMDDSGSLPVNGNGSKLRGSKLLSNMFRSTSSSRSRGAASRSPSPSFTVRRPSVSIVSDQNDGVNIISSDYVGEGVELVNQNEAIVGGSGSRKSGIGNNKIHLPPRSPLVSVGKKTVSGKSPMTSNSGTITAADGTFDMKTFESALMAQEEEYSDRVILNERRRMKERDGFCVPVLEYNGHEIWCTHGSKPDYAFGSYLGGGVAGVVYEADRMVADDPVEKVAVKILNPVSFRLADPSVLVDAVVVREGEVSSDDILKKRKVMTEKHVWWVVNPNSRNLRALRRPTSFNKDDGVAQIDRGCGTKGLRISLIAAYKDEEGLKELPLNRCIEIWGHAPFTSGSESEFDELMDAIERANSSSSKHSTTSIPLASKTMSSSSGGSSLNEVNLLNKSLSNVGLFRAVVSQRSIVYCSELSSYIAVPAVPPKYLRWLRQRRAATKEIRNMMRIGRHVNVVHLYEVLELVEEAKSTMFFILELVKGGELFDLISSPNPDRTHHMKNKFEGEQMMQKFFRELVSGIAYCHSNGIAHRDLKPENLLVHNCGDSECTLKIADFGLSAAFGVSSLEKAESERRTEQTEQRGRLDTETSGFSPLFSRTISDFFLSPSETFSSGLDLANAFLTCGNANTVSDERYSNVSSGFCFDSTANKNPNQPASPLRRMTSVVGSPHYVAPEIISQSNSNQDEKSSIVQDIGYDGTKADVWSAGVILYAMLYRSLPFGEDLLRCPRFVSFTKWYKEVRKTNLSYTYSIDFSDERLLGPKWFFPAVTSAESRDLIVSMLNPDPLERLTISAIHKHPWLSKKL